MLRNRKILFFIIILLSFVADSATARAENVNAPLPRECGRNMQTMRDCLSRFDSCVQGYTTKYNYSPERAEEECSKSEVFLGKSSIGSVSKPDGGSKTPRGPLPNPCEQGMCGPGVGKKLPQETRGEGFPQGGWTDKGSIGSDAFGKSWGTGSPPGR